MLTEAECESDGIGVPLLNLQQLPPNIYITRGRCAPRTICLPETCPPAMYRPSSWCVEDFHLHVQLYKGKASILYSATCRQSRIPVALKLYRKDKLSNLNWYQVEREIRLHSQLRHENIIQLYGAFEDAENVYLVQEYAEDGDLYEDLKRHKGRMEETRVAAAIVYPCMLALSYLHSKGIIHRDIKSENILLKADGTIKLADFGLSINYLEERPVTRAGTLDMMAPEVLVCPEKSRPEENKEKSMLEYTAAVDAWAVGIVAFELLVGHPPFEKESKQETYEHIMYRAPVLPNTMSEQAKSFIVSSLVKAVSRRPSVSDLLQHPWCQSHLPRLLSAPAAGQASKLEQQPPVISVNVDCTVPPSSQSVSRTASSAQSSHSVELLEREESSTADNSKSSMLQWANSSLKSITKKLRNKVPLAPDAVHQPSQKTGKKKYRPAGRSAQHKPTSAMQDGHKELDKESRDMLAAQARLEQKLAERPAALPLPTLLIPESTPRFSPNEVQQEAEDDVQHYQQSFSTPFGPSSQFEDIELKESPQPSAPALQPDSPPGQIQAFYPLPTEQNLSSMPPVRIRQPKPAPKPLVRSLEGLLLEDESAESRPTTYRRILRNTPAGLEADPESPPAYLARPWLTQRASKFGAESPPVSPRAAPGSPLVRRRRRIAGKLDSSASGSLMLAETPKGFPSGHHSARSFKQTPKSSTQAAGMGTLSRFGVNSASQGLTTPPSASLKSSPFRYDEVKCDSAATAIRRAQSAVPSNTPVARKLSLSSLNRDS